MRMLLLADKLVLQAYDKIITFSFFLFLFLQKHHFNPYILIAVNLVPAIFNLHSI